MNRFDLCLDGRFLTKKSINVRATKTMLVDLWKPAMGINIKDLSWYISVSVLPSRGHELGDHKWSMDF